jgi:hypothetical protein
MLLVAPRKNADPYSPTHHHHTHYYTHYTHYTHHCSLQAAGLDSFPLLQEVLMQNLLYKRRLEPADGAGDQPAASSSSSGTNTNTITSSTSSSTSTSSGVATAIDTKDTEAAEADVVAEAEVQWLRWYSGRLCQQPDVYLFGRQMGQVLCWLLLRGREGEHCPLYVFSFSPSLPLSLFHPCSHSCCWLGSCWLLTHSLLCFFVLPSPLLPYHLLPSHPPLLLSYNPPPSAEAVSAWNLFVLSTQQAVAASVQQGAEASSRAFADALLPISK